MAHQCMHLMEVENFKEIAKKDISTFTNKKKYHSDLNASYNIEQDIS